jgi:hypothetical protein
LLLVPGLRILAAMTQRWLWLWLAWTVACGRVEVLPSSPPTDATATDLAPAGSGQASDADVLADAAAPNDASATAADTLVRVLVTPVQGSVGKLVVRLIAPNQPLSVDSPGAFACFEGLVELPLEVSCRPPAGTWRVLAVLLNPAGKFLYSGTGCEQDKIVPIVTGPGLGEVQIEVKLKQASGDALCGAKLAGLGQPFLSQLDWIATPSTKDGGPHLMHGATWNQRWWLAGVQDGFVSFDFPKVPTSPPSKLANWQVHGPQGCVRLVRAGNDLICSGRTHKLQVLQLTADGQQVLGESERFLDSSLRAEGLLTVGSTLYVAAHQGGLRALEVAPGYPLKPFKIAGLGDTWDLAPLQAKWLAVADGEAGLRIVDPSQQITVATVPLPGRAAYVASFDGTIAVGTLGGGVHLVDAWSPQKPLLQASVDLPGDAFGVLVRGGQLFAAAGHDVLAWTLGKGAKLVSRGALRSVHFALDVKGFSDGQLLTAEFQSVRRLGVNEDAPTGGVLVLPNAVYTSVATVGQTLHSEVRMANLGSQAIKFGAPIFQESADAPPVALPVPPPLQPGEVRQVAIDVVKTQKGVLHHKVLWPSDDPASPMQGMSLDEGTWLRPGDKLPLLQYLDAAGKLHDVGAELKGKPGVVLVAAFSCQVAFLGLASAATALKPLLAADQIAVRAIDPWDKPDVAEASALELPFPMLFSPLNTGDGHDYSEVLDVKLGQPVKEGPPMPIVYVVDAAGTIVHAGWGWQTSEVLAALAKAKP